MKNMYYNNATPPYLFHATFTLRLKMPAAIYEQLKETMAVDNFQTKYQLLYTTAQAPGILLPFLAGVLVDKVNGRICLLTLSMVCFAGHAIASYGVEVERYIVF